MSAACWKWRRERHDKNFLAKWLNVRRDNVVRVPSGWMVAREATMARPESNAGRERLAERARLRREYRTKWLAVFRVAHPLRGALAQAIMREVVRAFARKVHP